MLSSLNQTSQYFHIDTGPTAVSTNKHNNSCSMSSYQGRKKDQRRTVRFRESVDVVATLSLFDKVDAPAWNAVWYQPSELEVFRSEARELCKKLMKEPLPRAADSESYLCTFALDRQRKKYMTRKLIVKVQRMNEVSGEKLARVAQRLTKWATEVAIDDAIRDYQQIHPFVEKRALDVGDEEWTRHVRPRMTPRSQSSNN